MLQLPIMETLLQKKLINKGYNIKSENGIFNELKN